ncbi:MAG: hypothetical protein JSU86_08245, partial [Phycisphaerales bacterium]
AIERTQQEEVRLIEQWHQTITQATEAKDEKLRAQLIEAGQSARRQIARLHEERELLEVQHERRLTAIQKTERDKREAQRKADEARRRAEQLASRAAYAATPTGRVGAAIIAAFNQAFMKEQMLRIMQQVAPLLPPDIAEQALRSLGLWTPAITPQAAAAPTFATTALVSGVGQAIYQPRSLARETRENEATRLDEKRNATLDDIYLVMQRGLQSMGMGA